MQNCPCGSNTDYTQCCGVFINEGKTPASAEQLMRSRYTAYTQANINYIERTMRAPANADFDPDATKTWAQQVEWIKLEIANIKEGKQKSFIEFFVIYSHNQKRYVMHELSEFHFEDGSWYYVNGIAPEIKKKPIVSDKFSRNEPCPCGSQKKYKKCCGALH
jgi:SEC-C motif domain protein